MVPIFSKPSKKKTASLEPLSHAVIRKAIGIANILMEDWRKRMVVGYSWTLINIIFLGIWIWYNPFKIAIKLGIANMLRLSTNGYIVYMFF